MRQGVGERAKDKTVGFVGVISPSILLFPLLHCSPCWQWQNSVTLAAEASYLQSVTGDSDNCISIGSRRFDHSFEGNMVYTFLETVTPGMSVARKPRHDAAGIFDDFQHGLSDCRVH